MLALVAYCSFVFLPLVVLFIYKYWHSYHCQGKKCLDKSEDSFSDYLIVGPKDGSLWTVEPWLMITGIDWITFAVGELCT